MCICSCVSCAQHFISYMVNFSFVRKIISLLQCFDIKISDEFLVFDSKNESAQQKKDVEHCCKDKNIKNDSFVLGCL